MRTELERVLPAQIERRSFEIIREELAQMGKALPEENAPVIMRCIHTSADFDYADNLVFTPGAVELAMEVLDAWLKEQGLA